MERDFYQRYFEMEDRHWWFVGRREIFLRILDQEFLPRRGSDASVLDVGCGTGTMLGYLSRYGAAQGVDASAEAVRFCRERGVQAVHQAAGASLPFESASFDLVTALDVVEHVDDDLMLLRELRRVTRAGGMLLVSVPAYQFLWGLQDEISHHRRRYRATMLRERMAQTGWRIHRLSYFNTFLFPPIAAIRLLRRVGPPPKVQSDFELTQPGRLNALLARVFSAEASLVERTSLPFGVSLLALASRVG
jgi:SAM-dependent methyltransferase